MCNRYQCEDGARLVGEQKVVCDGNNWNGTQPQCFGRKNPLFMRKKLISFVSVAPGVPQVSVAVDGVPNAGQTVNVGQNVTITCTASGGNPFPALSILLDSEPVASSLTVSTDQQVSYTWLASKSKTSWQAACVAENSAVDLPVHSDNIKLTLNCKFYNYNVEYARRES